MDKRLALVSVVLLVTACFVSVPFASAWVQLKTYQVDAVEVQAAGFDYNATAGNFTMTVSYGGVRNVTVVAWAVVKTTFVNAGGDGFCFYATWLSSGNVNLTVHPVSSNSPVEGTIFNFSVVSTLRDASASSDGTTFSIKVNNVAIYSSTQNVYGNLTHTNVAVSGSATQLTGHFSIAINNDPQGYSMNTFYLSIGGVVTVIIISVLLKKIK